MKVKVEIVVAGIAALVGIVKTSQRGDDEAAERSWIFRVSPTWRISVKAVCKENRAARGYVLRGSRTEN